MSRGWAMLAAGSAPFGGVSVQSFASDVNATDSAALCAEVAQAERCDREGRHADAVNLLAAGARRQDVEALTRLGKRLLVGDRAPLLPEHGAQLLLDASARGGAEAAAVLATLSAVGAGGVPDLAAAVTHLVTAAERGWRPAQAQLEVLAGATGSDHWRQLAAAIDLPSWQNPPASTELNGDPVIRMFPHFAGPGVCRWLIARARGRLTRARVYDALRRETTTHETRTNSAAVFDLLAADLVSVLVQTRMAAALGVPLRHLEAATVLHYAEGEQVTPHYDFVDPSVPEYERQLAERGQRIVTFLLYLNDDYEEGETDFPRLGVRHKAVRGQALYFVNARADGSPDVRTLHAGRPPVRGEKWIVSQFVKNRPAF